MSANDSNRRHTMLSDPEFEKCLRETLRFLETHPHIRNRDIRKAGAISYDQAIYFFNRAIDEGLLVRQGSGSGTHYTTANEGQRN